MIVFMLSTSIYPPSSPHGYNLLVCWIFHKRLQGVLAIVQPQCSISVGGEKKKKKGVKKVRLLQKHSQPAEPDGSAVGISFKLFSSGEI